MTPPGPQQAEESKDDYSFASSAASLLMVENSNNDNHRDNSPPPTSVFRQQRRRQQQQQHLALPLSMRLMKRVAGFCYCDDCSSSPEELEREARETAEISARLLNYTSSNSTATAVGSSLYCLPTAEANSSSSSGNGSTMRRRHRVSSASPLVLAPMTMSVVNEEEERILQQGSSGMASTAGGEGDDTNNNPASLSSSFLQTNGESQQQPQSVVQLRSSPHSTAPSSPTLSATSSSRLLTTTAAAHQQQQQPQLSATNDNLTNGTTTTTIPRSLPSSPYIVEKIVNEYIAACRFYGVGHRLNAGVLTTLRFSLPCMRITGRFHDDDMLALAEILLRYVNGPLRYITRLDFSLSGKLAPNRFGDQNTAKGMHSHGAFTLAKVLQVSQNIQEVFLDRNRIGPYGASAIFIACSTNSSLKKLHMRRCRVFERGARVFAEYVATSPTTALQEIDLSANYIGINGSLAVERALMDRMQLMSLQNPQEPLHHIAVDLEGNHVLQEVMNSITHGLGVILAVMGSYLMTQRVSVHTELRYRFSCAVYSASLIVLYMSSTLYHSFFSMQNTKYIFEVFDKCAIYILIAGSYTPFLQIVLGHKPIWSTGLLIFLWCCCCLGIAVEAMYPTWEHKMKFSLAMYLSMGWSALVCLPEISSLVPENCINVMILGGVGYTSGVPFFVRNNNLDHAVWHLFVMAGSIFHWCGVYFYVVDFVLDNNDDAAAANVTGTCVDNHTSTCLGSYVES